MHILTLVDVILGVVFVYLIFSLVASAINEALAAMCSSRAKWLHKGIRSLFGEERRGDDNVAAFYSSPFIRYLSDNSSWLVRGVSYIPAPAAMKALLTHTVATQESAMPLRQHVEMLLNRYARTALGVGDAIAALPAGVLHDNLKSLYDGVQGDVEAFMTGLNESIAKIEGKDLVEASEALASLIKRLAADFPQGWAALAATVDKLPAGSPIRAVMKDLMLTAEGDFKAFEAAFATWYTTFETQVGAWYRQKTHLVLVGISLFVAVSMNVDTIALVQQLSTREEVRAALVKQALTVAASNGVAEPQSAALAKARGDYEALLAANEKSPDTANTAKVEAALATYRQAQADFETALKEKVQSLEGAGLRFGWEEGAFSRAGKDWTGTLLLWFTKLIGLVLTAAALTLGAPFWFDMLKKVAQIRAVGQSLQEAAEGKKKEGA